MKKRVPALFIALAFSSSIFATAGSAEAPTLLSTQELEQSLRTKCESARRSNKPLLIEFTAPWCGDCVQLGKMKKEKALADELKHWEVQLIDVGRFDRHQELLTAYKIDAIAQWTLISPQAKSPKSTENNQCSKPATQWTRMTQRTLEPLSAKETITPAVLAKWLATWRAKLGTH